MNPLTHFRKITTLRFVLVALLCFGALLLICYSALAQGHRSDSKQGGSEHADRVSPGTQIPDLVSQSENESDPEFVKRQREWLDQFFGLGSVSPAAHARALAAARALPVSPLLRGRQFAPLTQVWTSPVPPPILNDFGGDGTTRIQALGLAPGPQNDVIYTGSFGGLARSTDAGATWQYLSDGWASQAVTYIAVSSSGSNIYVGTGADQNATLGVGVYGSTDSGATWNLHSTQFNGTLVTATAIDPNNSSTVYVANAESHDVTYPPGLYRSTDSGQTWKMMRQAGPHNSDQEWHGIHSVAIDPSSTLYIADDTGVLKSIDYGQTWTQVLSLPGCVVNVGCSVTRLSVVKVGTLTSNVYALGGVGQGRHLYISGAGGWTQIPTPCPCGSDNGCTQPCPPPCPQNGCNNIGLGVFAVDPNNPQIILGGTNYLFRTTNGGSSWSQIIGVHPDHRIMAFSADHPGVAYDGNDGGILSSTNHGQTWTNLNHNFPGVWLYRVALSQDGTMVGGTQDAGAVFSNFNNGFQPWNHIYAGDSYYNLIDPNTAATGYVTDYTYGGIGAGTNFARFLRATPFSTVSIRPPQFNSDLACGFFPTFSMNLSSPGHLVAACAHVARTLDGTASPTPTWTTIGAPLTTPSPGEIFNTVSAAAEAPNNSNVIYAVGAGNKVWVTTNANLGQSATWTDATHTLPGGIRAIAVDPTDSKTAYVASNSNVYKTTDTGTTWTPKATANLIYRDVVINPSFHQQVFVGCNGGVLESDDGGGSWYNLSIGSIPNGIIVNGLSLNDPSQTLAAATQGRGVYLILLTGTRNDGH